MPHLIHIGEITMSDIWLPTLITSDPQSGYELAIKLSRMAIKKTQPNDTVRVQLRSIYEEDAAALIVSSAVVATNFQTVAAANNYWKD